MAKKDLFHAHADGLTNQFFSMYGQAFVPRARGRIIKLRIPHFDFFALVPRPARTELSTIVDNSELQTSARNPHSR